MNAQAHFMTPDSHIVGLQIIPPAIQGDRLPFHLALLLDTSSSMSGSRIESVRRTLFALIDTMAETDTLTLLEYNSRAKVHCCACSDKTRLRQITESLHCIASTNLEEALHLFATLDVPAEKPIQTVCILTDGQNTEGLQSTQELKFLAKRRIPAGIPVCALGYGDDHNESLLQALAVSTRGSYNYIGSDEMVPVTVGNIVGSMESEVAKKAYLDLSPGDRCLEPMAEDGSFWIGSLFAEKPQWIVLEKASGDPLQLRWRSSRTGEEEVQEIIVSAVAEENKDVRIQHFRVLGLVAMSEAKKALEANTGNYDSLIAKLNTLKTDMEGSSVADAPLIVRMLAQIHTLMETLQLPPESSFPTPMFARYLGRQSSYPLHHGGVHQFLTRLTSDMTTMTVQRGIMSGSQDPGTNEDPDMFTSPVARNVSSALAHGYSQTQNPI